MKSDPDARIKPASAARPQGLVGLERWDDPHRQAALDP